MRPRSPTAWPGSSGDRIPVPYGSPDLPPPGWYRMWWLDRPPERAAFRRKVLLSIDSEPQPAPRLDPDRAPPLRRELLTAFGCAEPDLERNRAGALAPRRRRSLRRTLVGPAVGILFGLAVAAGFFVLCGYDLDQARAQPWGYTIVALIPGLFGALALVATGYSMRNARRIAADLRAMAPVASAVGPVLVRGNGDGTAAVDSVEFPVSEAVARAFAEPGSYALYHLSKPLRLLLAEPDNGTTERLGP